MDKNVNSQKTKKLAADYKNELDKIETRLAEFQVAVTKLLADLYKYIEKSELDYHRVWQIFTKNNKSTKDIFTIKKDALTEIKKHKKALFEIERFFNELKS